MKYYCGIFCVLLALLGCSTQTVYSDDVPACSQLQGEPRMLCLRPDLSELYGEIRALREQAENFPDGDKMLEFANARSDLVYEYCFERFQREANCAAERLETLRDQLSLQILQGSASFES